jgi:hypothetical protein
MDLPRKQMMSSGHYRRDPTEIAKFHPARTEKPFLNEFVAIIG